MPISSDDLMTVRLPNGIMMELEVTHSGLLSEIYAHEVYDIHHTYKDHDVIFDVGAHFGTFTLKAAEKRALVHAFEPHPDNFFHLKKNVNLNGPINVICHDCALGDEIGSFKFWTDPTLSGSHSLKFKKDTWIVVKVLTLDKVIEQENIKHVSLLKMDVEGAEPEVLRGAKKNMDKVDEVAVAAYHFTEEVGIVEALLDVLGFKTSTESRGPYIDTKFVYGRR